MGSKYVLIGIMVLVIIGVLFVALSSNDNNAEGVAESTNAVNSAASLVRVPVAEFVTELENNPEKTLLDIRTPAEYNSGKIERSVNIDYYEANFEAELMKLDKDAPYLLYCNSGNRSGDTLQIMRKLGFTDVKELVGGIQAWYSAGYDTCTSC